MSDSHIGGLEALQVAVCGATQKHLDELEERVDLSARSFDGRVAREEGRCGFFAFVLTAAPRYLTMIETLRADHRRISAAFMSLRGRIRGAELADWEDLEAQARAIEEAIEQHEELERAILDDALSAG
jgi:hypothetical protein